MTTTTNDKPIAISRWYAIQVASQCENRVKSVLSQRAEVLKITDKILNIEIPKITEIKVTKGGNKKPTQKPALPGYVLVNMILDEETMMAINTTPNIIGFVGVKDLALKSKYIKPKPLKQKEVDKLLNIAKKEDKPVINYNLQEGDLIMATEGPFANFEGEVVSISNEQSKIRALMSIFGRETPVELEMKHVRKQMVS